MSAELQAWKKPLMGIFSESPQFWSMLPMSQVGSCCCAWVEGRYWVNKRRRKSRGWAIGDIISAKWDGRVG